MARKIRKDITVGALEKKLKLAPGTITNSDGRDARSDKKLETLQKEAVAPKRANAPRKPAVKRAPANTTKTAAPTTNKSTAKRTTSAKIGSTVAAPRRPKVNAAQAVTADQKTAAKRTVKSHPKTSAMVRKVRAALSTKPKK